MSPSNLAYYMHGVKTEHFFERCMCNYCSTKGLANSVETTRSQMSGASKLASRSKESVSSGYFEVAQSICGRPDWWLPCIKVPSGQQSWFSKDAQRLIMLLQKVTKVDLARTTFVEPIFHKFTGWSDQTSDKIRIGISDGLKPLTAEDISLRTPWGAHWHPYPWTAGRACVQQAPTLQLQCEG